MDKLGLLKDILTKAADLNTNITYANVKTNQAKKIGIIEMGVEVNGIDNLTTIMNAFQSFPEVHSVKRIQTNSRIRTEQTNIKKNKTPNIITDQNLFPSYFSIQKLDFIDLIIPFVWKCLKLEFKFWNLI